MQFAYGGFGFDENSVYITGFTSSFIRGPTGRPHLLKKSLACRGKIVRPNMSQVMFQLSAIQSAMAVNGLTAVLYDNFGVPTPFVLDSPSSVGGVMVTQGCSQGEVKGAEGTTYLYYTFALEADYLWSGGTDVLEFSETLAFSDNQGFPMQVERLPQNAAPIIQNVSQSSFYHCTQSGTLKQSGANPIAPGPTFPGLFRGVDGSNQIALLPVRAIRGQAIEYGVSWKYEFISIDPFTGGTPNFR